MSRRSWWEPCDCNDGLVGVGTSAVAVCPKCNGLGWVLVIDTDAADTPEGGSTCSRFAPIAQLEFTPRTHICARCGQPRDAHYTDTPEGGG